MSVEVIYTTVASFSHETINVGLALVHVAIDAAELYRIAHEASNRTE
jgi:hypothetical protein